jgi:hypothetical protein
MKYKLFSLSAFLIAFSSEALAYLDPGAGSLLLQLLIGGAGGLIVILRLYWHKILLLLRVRKDVIDIETDINEIQDKRDANSLKTHVDKDESNL